MNSSQSNLLKSTLQIPNNCQKTLFTKEKGTFVSALFSVFFRVLFSLVVYPLVSGRGFEPLFRQ